MNTAMMLFSTLGGLALLLFGMRTMTDGLQMTAGQSIRSILNRISSNRLMGCLTGATITAVIQSSSATTVMLVGLVAAGLMNLYQAVSIILGANIGTTITAQLIAFNLEQVALPAVALGVGMKFFAVRKKIRFFGDIILGFGLLFLGLIIMKQSLMPLRTDPKFISFFTQFGVSTLLQTLICVGLGTLLTILIQSSAATIGLTMALASQGLIDFPTAMAFVLGENIGTTITAQLSTIGSNAEAHQVANAHTLFNIIGVIFTILLFPFFVKAVIFCTQLMNSNGSTENINRYIANGHTLFNLVNALFFLTIMPWLVKMTRLLSPEDNDDKDLLTLPQFGDRLLDNPLAAVAKIRDEIFTLSLVLRLSLESGVKLVSTKDLKLLKKCQQYEDYIDSAHQEILRFIAHIFQSGISNSLATEISGLMRISYHIERIGNSVVNINRQIAETMEEKQSFTPQAWADLELLGDTVFDLLDLVSTAIHKYPPNLLKEATMLEDRIDELRNMMRKEHVERIRESRCAVDTGIIFLDVITRFEKIGDWTFDIAKTLEGINKNQISGFLSSK